MQLNRITKTFSLYHFCYNGDALLTPEKTCSKQNPLFSHPSNFQKCSIPYSKRTVKENATKD